MRRRPAVPGTLRSDKAAALAEFPNVVQMGEGAPALAHGSKDGQRAPGDLPMQFTRPRQARQQACKRGSGKPPIFCLLYSRSSCHHDDGCASS
jgi:hypothetical protein